MAASSRAYHSVKRHLLVSAICVAGLAACSSDTNVAKTPVSETAETQTSSTKASSTKGFNTEGSSTKTTNTQAPLAKSEAPKSGSTGSAISDMANAVPIPVNPVYLKTDPGAGKLTPKRLHADPSLDGSRLRRAAVSPDGAMVTVLRGRDDAARQQDLWAYDLETGEASLLVSSTELLGAPETLSLEEKNRRERAREYNSGIVSYSWANENLLLFPLGGDVYTYDLSARKATQVTATEGFETDAKVSPLGTYASYVRGNELYVSDLKSGAERKVTSGSTDTIRNATASFVVQEELDRFTGYWWSPDESRFAYTQIDESPVAISNRIEFGADGVDNIAQRYPYAGTDNATIKLGVVSRNGGRTKWVDLGDDKDIYLTRVIWSKDAKTMYAGVLSRDQKSHKILEINPNTGASKTLFEDTSQTWLNIGTDFKALADGSLLWSTEASGKRGIVKIAKDGTVLPVTPENVLVNAMSCISEDTGTVYFTGWKDNALERHIFKVDLSGENLTQITKAEGRHSASFSNNCARYIGNFSNITTPPQSRAFANDGTPLVWLNENALDETHPYAPFKGASIQPEFGQLKADDGQVLNYMVYKPLDLKKGEKRPVINVLYGGPGVQKVHKGWERRHFERMLAHHGFVVFTMDNRGSSNRGTKFEDGLYRGMGGIEVKDQSLGMDWLKAQPYVDPEKIGVYGWSYGGYLTLHMLAQTDHFKAGVAGAPVTDWALYDTAYTERYLGSPVVGSKNYTEGSYENGSVFAHLDGLTEPTLVIHGMADDNVVFRNTINLMDAVQKGGTHNVRFMTYPGEKHGFRNQANKVHRDTEILEFFTKHLGP